MPATDDAPPRRFTFFFRLAPTRAAPAGLHRVSVAARSPDDAVTHARILAKQNHPTSSWEVGGRRSRQPEFADIQDEGLVDPSALGSDLHAMLAWWALRRREPVRLLIHQAEGELLAGRPSLTPRVRRLARHQQQRAVRNRALFMIRSSLLCCPRPCHPNLNALGDPVHATLLMAALAAAPCGPPRGLQAPPEISLGGGWTSDAHMQKAAGALLRDLKAAFNYARGLRRELSSFPRPLPARLKIFPVDARWALKTIDRLADVEDGYKDLSVFEAAEVQAEIEAFRKSIKQASVTYLSQVGGPALAR